MLPRVNIVSGDNANYLLFSTNDHITQSIYLTGSWDQVTIKVSQLFLEREKNPVVLDIGANLGAYAIPVAKSIERSGGRVYCFEPQRIVYYQLCGNIFLNSLDNVFAFNNAVGLDNDNIEIPEIDYSENNNIGAFSIDPESRKHHGIESSMKDETFSVGMINLDSINGPYNIALLKLDVEGLELNVIKGGREFFKRYGYPPFFFELWDFDWFAEKKAMLLEEIKNLGYECFKIHGDNYIAQHRKHRIFYEFANTNGKLEIKKTM